MPRLEFDSFFDAKQWLTTFVKASDKGYVGYYTSRKELILIPTKSTQPILYGYVRNTEEKDARAFSDTSGIIVYKISSFEWDAERTRKSMEA